MVDCQDPTGIYTCLAEAVFAEVIGFNVLEKLLAEKDKIDEIQVVGERIFEIRGGIEYLSAYQFSHVSQVERLQQNLVLFNHDLMNHGKRWAEVQLTDGSRVSMTGFGFSSVPTLTIRFYSHHCWNLERLVTLGAMDNGVKSLLMSSLMNRLNMVLIGPTNSGKTMLLKALVSELPDSERLITIESRRELMLHRDFPNKNVIEYEIDESDVQHDGAQAFKLALRQSPRRIIHAEIRDTDANLYVRACTRGHNGSMTTLHASSLEDVPDVIAEMCMQDGRSYDADVLALRIARYVVQIGIETGQLDSSGTRGIKRIVQYEVHAGKLCLVELVKYDSAKNKWSLPTTAPKRAVG
jgi:pilus assembly protein CpaF